jgi:hypothetical protein
VRVGRLGPDDRLHRGGLVEEVHGHHKPVIGTPPLRRTINMRKERVMNVARCLRTFLLGLVFIGALAVPAAVSANASDSLYVGDQSDNTLKQFDATTGASLGTFVPTSAGLIGPRGILHVSNGHFLVANQNVGLPIPGEIDQFDHTGASLGPLVPSTSPHAPFAPRGLILGPDQRTLYVADFGSATVGQVETYDVHSGNFLGNLDFSSFITNSAVNPTGEFHPRGVVFGPDGRLYVSLFSENFFPQFGWVLSYDPRTRAVAVIASNSPNGSSGPCGQYLNAPEGLTFGPPGTSLANTLYLVGRRLNTGAATDTDKISGINATNGTCNTINLDGPTGPDAYAQALVFGPAGDLFLPVRSTTSPAATDVGAVRRYNVSTTAFTDFVAPVTDAGQPASLWYLTFGQTSPVTLAYGD